MIKLVEVEIGGIDYPLNFSVAAFAECNSRFGGLDMISEALNKETNKEAVANILWLFCLLNEWGAKYKRITDGTEGNVIGYEKLGATMKMRDIIKIETGVWNALHEGMKRKVEVEPNPKNVKTTQTKE